MTARSSASLSTVSTASEGAAYPERTIRFVTALLNELRSLDVTMMITEETQKLLGPEVEVRIQGLSALVDNILLLEYMDVGSELKRLLSVVKTRGTGHDANIRELCISNKGIEIAADATSAGAILTGPYRTGRDPGRSRPS